MGPRDLQPTTQYLKRTRLRTWDRFPVVVKIDGKELRVKKGKKGWAGWIPKSEDEKQKFQEYWSPTDAALCMSVPPTLFPIRTLRLSTRTFPPTVATQSSSSARTTSRTAETEISSAWQYRRNAEDFHSPAAKMTPIGEPAAASEVALPALNAFKVHLFASLWPNSVSMRRTALRNEELARSRRDAPAPLLRSSGATACTAQQCGDAPAQAQVRTSRLPCGLCFLLASLMWRESKPPSHDSIQTVLCRPQGPWPHSGLGGGIPMTRVKLHGHAAGSSRVTASPAAPPIHQRAKPSPDPGRQWHAGAPRACP